MAGLRDRVSDVLGENGPDPRWRQHVTELLYDGESVVESIDVGDARVVVTSHRVLAFTPGAEGAAFQQVDRPNVVGVGSGARGEDHLLGYGARFGLAGVVLLGAGLVLDMDAIVGDVSLGGGAGSQIGVGGVLGLVRRVLELLRRLDEFLAMAGALAVLLAAVALGAYRLTREPTYVLEIAGEEPDIHVPRGDPHAGVRERLETAIAPGTDSNLEA